MKRFFLFFLFCLLSGSCLPQAKELMAERSVRYFNQTGAGFAFGVGNFKTDLVEGIQRSVRNDQTIIDLHTVNGISYLDRVYLGLGLGAEMWSSGLFFPIYGQISGTLKPADNTIIASLGIGYAIGTRDSTSRFHEGTGDVRVQVGIGFRNRVSRNLCFMYEFFYRYQAISSDYSVWPNDSTTYLVDYKVPLSFVGFRIAIQLP